MVRRAHHSPLLQRDLLKFERKLIKEGLCLIAGTDEAGRGCLAGPVFAGAVILPPGLEIPKIDDSKKLTPERREFFYDIICQKAVSWSVASISPEEIDGINIHQASLKAMHLAVSQLTPVPEFLLVDGKFPIPHFEKQKPIIDGDALSQTIAAASILAKVSRDRLMRDLEKEYSGFSFSRHKGYGTRQHIQEIRQNGLTPIHRKSFSNCRRG